MHKHYVYEIPDILKVGVTSNPKNRIEEVQGFSPWENYILETFTSADQADMYEKQEQFDRYGYTDDDYYPALLNPIIIKHTGKATCTLWGVSYEDADSVLEGRKIDIKGPDGVYKFTTTEDIEWLQANKEKGFQDESNAYWRLKRITNYVEMKALRDIEVTVEADYPEEYSFDAIRQWAKDKKLYGHPNSSIRGQALKLGEEVGETQKAVLKNNTPEIVDGIGDIIVVLTSLAELAGVSIEDCIQMAWTEIRTRDGFTNDEGDFIKQSDK